MQKFLVLATVAAGLLAVGCAKSPEVRHRQAAEKGKQLLDSKDYARAVLEFKNAVQVRPSDAESHYQLALALFGSGDIRAAVASLRRATELNPGHSQAQIRLAEILTRTTNNQLLQDAVQRMETLLESAPENADALSTLANAELKLGEVADAEEHLARAVAKGRTNIRAAVGLAKLRISQKKFDEAEQILRRVADQKPPSALAYLAMGEFYIGMKKRPDAKREFLHALEAEKENVLALTYMGTLYLMDGQVNEAEGVYKRLAQAPQKEYRAAHATFLLRTGKSNEGIKELEELFNKDRNDRTLRRTLLASYLAAGRTADVERTLEEVLAKNKQDTDALLYKSNLLIARGKYDEAADSLGKVLKYEPQSAEAHYLLAQIHASRGNVNSRRQELTEAVRLNREFVGARVELARLLLSTKAAKAALDVIDETPDWQRNNPQVIAQRNWILAVMGNKAEVKKGVDSGLAISRTPELLLQDAVLKMDGRDFNGGRALLQEVLQKTPEDTRAVELLVHSYVAQGQVGTGLQKVKEHAAAYPKSAKLQHHLGMLLNQNGQIAEAKSALERAKSIDPGFWPSDVALASIEVAHKHHQSAKRRLEGLLSHPQAAGRARLLLAQVEHKDGKGAAAIAHYRKVLESQPDNVLALNNLAYALVDEGNADEGLKFAERAKELAPDNATVDDTLGWILYRRGLHGRAVQHLENAVKRQPTAVRHAHLALAYAAKGDTIRGFEQLQAAMKLNPKTPEVEAAQKALASAR